MNDKACMHACGLESICRNNSRFPVMVEDCIRRHLSFAFVPP